MSVRDQGLLIGLATIAIGSVAWFLWLNPMALDIKQADSQLATLDGQKESLAARLALIDATSRDLANNPDAARLLNLAAPTTGGMENLLVSFDTMATASGINLVSLQPASASDQPTQLTLTVSVSGSFTGIQAFVAAIERNIRPLAIQMLSLSSAASATGDPILAASFTLTTPTLLIDATNLAGTP